MKLAIIATSAGLLLNQCDPAPEPTEPDITVCYGTEAAFNDFEIPCAGQPYTRIWVKMDATNYDPDMRYRCQNMGGHLVDDVCHDIDF